MVGQTGYKSSDKAINCRLFYDEPTESSNMSRTMPVYVRFRPGGLPPLNYYPVTGRLVADDFAPALLYTGWFHNSCLPAMFEPPKPNKVPTLNYRKLQEGRDYWVQDNFLPNADEVSERAFSRSDWELGFPHAKEFWPGMRSHNIMLPDEMAEIEKWVKKATGMKKLWQPPAPEGAKLNHNCAQLVGERESGPRPHTDSRKLCRFAAVIYLSKNPQPGCGTSFYRLRYPNGSLGGNQCTPPHNNLGEALGVTKLPLQAWHEDFSVENVYNRMILYRADLVHSATNYFGVEHNDKRMTALFFWQAS